MVTPEGPGESQSIRRRSAEKKGAVEGLRGKRQYHTLNHSHTTHSYTTHSYTTHSHTTHSYTTHSYTTHSQTITLSHTTHLSVSLASAHFSIQGSQQPVSHYGSSSSQLWRAHLSAVQHVFSQILTADCTGEVVKWVPLQLRWEGQW